MAANPAEIPASSPIPSSTPQNPPKVPTWDEVKSLPEMRDLSNDDLELARWAYFEDVIKPTIPPEELEGAQAAFDEDTRTGAIGRGLRNLGKTVEAVGRGVAEGLDSAGLGQRQTASGRRAWVAEMMPHAERVAADLGVAPEFIIAQAAQETGWGKHAPNNNYFGIKGKYRGQGQELNTVEGAGTPERASFRAYPSAAESFDDYGALLKNPRYAGALNTPTVEDFARGLVKGGYATDPVYVDRVAANYRDLERMGFKARNLGAGVTPAAKRPETFGLPVTPEYMAEQRARFDAATPDQRAQVAGADDIQGRAWQALGGEAEQAGAVLRHDPGLLAMSDRREDRELAYRLQVPGMDPKEATRRALEDIVFQRPSVVDGSASSTDFDFERAAELRGAGPVRRGLESGWTGLQQQAAGMNKLLADLGVELGIPGAEGYGEAQMKARKRLDLREMEAGEAGNPFDRNLEGAIASTISNVPALVAGVFSGGETLPLMGMSMQVVGDEYAHAIEQGKDKRDALARAIPFGAAEFLGEKLGFRDQVDLLKRAVGGNATEFERQFVKTMAEQIAGEQFTTAAQFGVDLHPQYGLNPTATAQDYFNQAKDTLFQTFLQTAMMGAPGGVRAGFRRADAAVEGQALTPGEIGGPSAEGIALRRLAPGGPKQAQNQEQRTDEQGYRGWDQNFLSGSGGDTGTASVSTGGRELQSAETGGTGGSAVGGAGGVVGGDGGASAGLYRQPNRVGADADGNGAGATGSPSAVASAAGASAAGGDGALSAEDQAMLDGIAGGESSVYTPTEVDRDKGRKTGNVKTPEEIQALIQPGDIVNHDGRPFEGKMAAEKVIKARNLQGYRPVNLGYRAFVLRLGGKKGVQKADGVVAGSDVGTDLGGRVLPEGQGGAGGKEKKTINLDGMGDAIVGNLYDALFDALKQGKSTLHGVKDPVLKRAKPAFDAGLVKSAGDLQRFENEGYPAIPEGPQSGRGGIPTPERGNDQVEDLAPEFEEYEYHRDMDAQGRRIYELAHRLNGLEDGVGEDIVERLSIQDKSNEDIIGELEEAITSRTRLAEAEGKQGQGAQAQGEAEGKGGAVDAGQGVEAVVATTAAAEKGDGERAAGRDRAGGVGEAASAEEEKLKADLAAAGDEFNAVAKEWNEAVQAGDGARIEALRPKVEAARRKLAALDSKVSNREIAKGEEKARQARVSEAANAQIGTRARPSEFGAERGIYWEKTDADEWTGRGDWFNRDKTRTDRELAKGGGYVLEKPPEDSKPIPTGQSVGQQPEVQSDGEEGQKGRGRQERLLKPDDTTTGAGAVGGEGQPGAAPISQAGGAKNEARAGVEPGEKAGVPTDEAPMGVGVSGQGKPVEPDAGDAGQSAAVEKAGFGTGNKLFTEDRAERARKILRSKLGQLSAGLDPELVAAGIDLAGYYLEGGVRRFADVARAIANDLGMELEALRPHLRSWYNGARDALEDGGHDIAGADDAEAVKREIKRLFEPQAEPEASSPHPEGGYSGPKPVNLGGRRGPAGLGDVVESGHTRWQVVRLPGFVGDKVSVQLVGGLGKTGAWEGQDYLKSPKTVIQKISIGDFMRRFAADLDIGELPDSPGGEANGQKNQAGVDGAGSSGAEAGRSQVAPAQSQGGTDNEASGGVSDRPQGAPERGSDEVGAGAGAAAVAPATLADVPGTFLVSHKVAARLYDPDTHEYYAGELPAQEALDALDADVRAFEVLRNKVVKCLEGVANA